MRDSWEMDMGMRKSSNGATAVKIGSILVVMGMGPWFGTRVGDGE
jgi:hypothetical protein